MSKIKYIFSINTGRCGSDYLSKIFSKVEGCNSNHEADPIGNGKFMFEYNLGKRKNMELLAKSKFNDIINETSSGIYADTSHLFIKGFGNYVKNYIDEKEVGIIILKRDKKSVVNSFYRIHSSLLLHNGKKWLLSPNKHNPLIQPPSFLFLSSQHSYLIAWYLKRLFSRINKFLFATFSTKVKEFSFIKKYEFQCLEWYYDETYALADDFKRKHSNIKFYEVQLEQLNNQYEVERLLQFFDLKYNSNIDAILGKASNNKSYV